MLVRLVSLGRFTAGNRRKGTEGEYESCDPKNRALAMESRIDSALQELVRREGRQPDVISVTLEHIVTGMTGGYSEAFLVAQFSGDKK